MSCPFMNRAGKLDLNELPELSMETVSGLTGHSGKVNLVICCGFIFDVTSDSSFNSLPLSEYLFKDATEAILKLQFSATFNGQGDQKSIDSDFERIDSFSKMQMKSNLLKLFCEKYKAIAKLQAAAP
jgi:hypothetical protein